MSEPEGGDAACWAHLFDEYAGEGAGPASGVVAVDVDALAAVAGVAVPWSTQSADLNVNLLVFAAGDGVAPHVNGEVDVLLAGVSGEGEIVVGGERFPLRPGRVVLVPKGQERSTVARSDRFAYLSCHRARKGLMPAPRRPKEGRHDH
ncbi:MAG: cupin domain-containing protein [Thermomicrobiales bacterium]